MLMHRWLTVAAASLSFALPVAAQQVTLRVHHFWPPVAMPPSTRTT